MNLRILAEAEDDVRESVEWYEGRGTGLGDAFLKAITKAFLAIESDPQRNPTFETKGRKGDIRTMLVVKFPFSVIYEIRENESIILAVAHHKRRPNFWKSRNPDV